MAFGRKTMSQKVSSQLLDRVLRSRMPAQSQQEKNTRQQRLYGRVFSGCKTSKNKMHQKLARTNFFLILSCLK